MTEYAEFAPAAEQPAEEDKLEPKGCLPNSVEMAQERGLGYAEGIAQGYLGLWYRHAWNVNEAGEAVDYTWTRTGTRYIGRVIDAGEKWEAAVRSGWFTFEDDCPLVPDGEMGIDCHSAEQLAMWEKLRKMTVDT